MKKFIGFVVAVVAAVFMYQWLDNKTELNLTEQVTTTITDTIDRTKVIFQDNEWLQADPELNQISNDVAGTSTSDIVDEIASHLDKRETNFTVNMKGKYEEVKQNFSSIVEQALKKDDYIYYTMSNYRYTLSGSNNHIEAEINIDYRETAEMTAEVRSYVQQALKKMKIEQYSDYEKVKMIHDWIVTSVQYDQTYQHYTAYEAITTGTTVCQGYSLLGLMFFREAGFEAYIVEGTGNGEDHAWNKVLIGEHWYNIDMTWDDPIGQEKDEVSYTYFLISDEALARDHIWKGEYPVAAISYNEYLKDQLAKFQVGSAEYEQIQETRESMLYHLEDAQNLIQTEQNLYEKLKTTVKNRHTEIQFVFAGGDEIVDLVQSNFKKLNTGLSYKISYGPYQNTDDLLVKIQITYK